jgi:hypothetical protein
MRRLSLGACDSNHARLIGETTRHFCDHHRAALPAVIERPRWRKRQPPAAATALDANNVIYLALYSELNTQPTGSIED